MANSVDETAHDNGTCVHDAGDPCPAAQVETHEFVKPTQWAAQPPEVVESEPELKPCPFCRKTPRLITCQNHISVGGMITFATCQSGECILGGLRVELSAWNTRAGSPQPTTEEVRAKAFDDAIATVRTTPILSDEIHELPQGGTITEIQIPFTAAAFKEQAVAALQSAKESK